MAFTAIHLGEHLAEELKALGISASELARKLGVPPSRVTAIPEWPARHYRGHGSAAGSFLRHQRTILAESAEPI